MIRLKKNRSHWWIAIVAITIVAGGWIANYFLLVNLTDRGTFGDMFGAVSAAFSGLAFGGIIYTILLQRKELELQREELVETRNEFHQQNRNYRLNG